MERLKKFIQNSIREEYLITGNFFLRASKIYSLFRASGAQNSLDEASRRAPQKMCDLISLAKEKHTFTTSKLNLDSTGTFFCLLRNRKPRFDLTPIANFSQLLFKYRSTNFVCKRACRKIFPLSSISATKQFRARKLAKNFIIKEFAKEFLIRSSKTEGWNSAENLFVIRNKNFKRGCNFAKSNIALEFLTFL